MLSKSENKRILAISQNIKKIVTDHLYEKSHISLAAHKKNPFLGQKFLFFNLEGSNLAGTITIAL